MERKASDAIDDAKRWLSAAESSEKAGSYDIALYSAEMALEIAMKAVLINKGVDYPKKHDITDYFKTAVDSRSTVKELRDELPSLISTFSELLNLRNAAGYNIGTLRLDEATASKTRELLKRSAVFIGIIERELRA